ncbi:MAG TPA: hypothetical protein V6D05_02055 [Stenomitos sp.]
MPDINDLKVSAEKLAKAAAETAELGVQVAREQFHGLIKDPEVRRRMEEAEATFDNQMKEVSKRIEEGANQMFSMFNSLLAQQQHTEEAKAPETSTEEKKD